MEFNNDNLNDSQQRNCNKAKDYNIIYAYTINDLKHDGLLKIGTTLIPYEDIDNIRDLTDNSSFLKFAAKSKIEQNDKILTNQCTIVYSTLGTKNNDECFNDEEVNEWLRKNCYNCQKKLDDNSQWWDLSSNQIRKAIDSIKNYVDYYDIESTRQLDSVGLAAINQTFSWFANQNRFYWICEKENDAIAPALFLIKKSQKEEINHFNHVLIVTNQLDTAEDWFSYFKDINGKNSLFSFLKINDYANELALKKINKSNELTNFISYLDINEYDRYKDVINNISWNLIIINLINVKIDTLFESKISSSSLNVKWLYFSKEAPYFCLSLDSNFSNINSTKKDLTQSKFMGHSHNCRFFWKALFQTYEMTTKCVVIFL